MSDSARPHVDVAQVMAEIEAEVRDRRQRGDLPIGLEHEMDRVFAQFAPVGAVHEDFSAVLDKVDEAAFVDAAVPVASDLPGGSTAKRAVRRLVGWQLDYVVRQLTSFHHATARALRRLDQRLAALEEASGAFTAPVVPNTAALDRRWTAVIAPELRAAPGRVLHADAGRGELVAGLVEAGVDAYGAEPSSEAAMLAAGRGLDVRNDAVIDHLRTVPSDGLGAIVLTGCVDRIARPVQLALAALAASKVAAGGVLIVIATEPEVWVRERPPVEVDLAPGRPLHPDTWCFLLEQAGLEVERRTPADVPAGEYALVARRR
jgi:hypothetical protein